LFGCGQGQLPIRYLGIPIHYQRLTVVEWKSVEQRVVGKVNCFPRRKIVTH
jgi:hypothetical protein